MKHLQQPISILRMMESNHLETEFVVVLVPVVSIAGSKPRNGISILPVFWLRYLTVIVMCVLQVSSKDSSDRREGLFPRDVLLQFFIQGWRNDILSEHETFCLVLANLSLSDYLSGQWLKWGSGS